MSQSPITHDPGKPTPPDSPTPAGVPAPTNDQAAPVERDPCLILTDRYPDAVAFAATLHAKQSRKGGDIPYISHLLGVSSLIIEARGDEDQAIAGLLHDAAEDCGESQSSPRSRSASVPALPMPSVGAATRWPPTRC